MKTRVVSGKLYVQNEKHGFIKGSLLISSKGFLKSLDIQHQLIVLRSNGLLLQKML